MIGIRPIEVSARVAERAMPQEVPPDCVAALVARSQSAVGETKLVSVPAGIGALDQPRFGASLTGNSKRLTLPAKLEHRPAKSCGQMEAAHSWFGELPQKL